MHIWRDLVDYVAPHAPDAPDTLIEQFIRLAAIRLCERSGVLKQHLLFDSQKDVGDYPLELDDCMRPQTVYTVCVNGSHYRPQTDQSCCNTYCSAFFLHEPTTLNISPSPSRSIENGIHVWLSVKPSQDSCEVDDILYEDFAETLMYGALARLHGMKQRPWSDKNLMLKFEKDFYAGVARAQIRAYKGFTRGPMILKARPFVAATGLAW